MFPFQIQGPSAAIRDLPIMVFIRCMIRTTFRESSCFLCTAYPFFGGLDIWLAILICTWHTTSMPQSWTRPVPIAEEGRVYPNTPYWWAFVPR